MIIDVYCMYTVCTCNALLNELVATVSLKVIYKCLIYEKMKG